MIELTLAKTHLRVDGSAEDELVQAYIDAAAAWIEGDTRKLLERREVTQELQRFGAYVPLWWGPEPLGAVIDYVDGDAAAQTVAAPRLLRDRVYPPVAGWPTALDYSPIMVTYEAGYADGEVPADLVQAQLLLVAHWYLNREAVVTGTIATEVPLTVEAICRQYRPVLI